MKKLNPKTIHQAIRTAENASYFEKLNKIYSTIPQGKCGGCTKCCMESVHTHFVEFLNIFRYMKENRRLYEELLPKIIRYYFLELVTKEHCPFLNDQGMCSIYDYRPLVCRLFGHWTQEEYEESYKNVLSTNLQNMKLFKNKYKILLPAEVVNYKIAYCKDFEVHKKMVKTQRQAMIDNIFTMESAFFMRGLITEEFLDTGLVSWFVYSLFEREEAGEKRVVVIREYLEEGHSQALEGLLQKVQRLAVSR